jgi:hypothetical protein
MININVYVGMAKENASFCHEERRLEKDKKSGESKTCKESTSDLCVIDAEYEQDHGE